MTTYKIIRYFASKNVENAEVKTGLSLTEAQAHCQDPETSWNTATSPAGKRRTQLFGEWFDGYVREQ